VQTIFVVILSYFLGSIPFSAIAGRLRGVDLGETGSGNLGSTNVVRVLGPAVGIPVFLCDVAKGFVAVVVVAAIPGADAILGPTGVRVAAGLAAVAGHIWSVFARFKGGKGAATACGMFLGLAPLPTLAVFVIWLGVIFTTRYVSVGSIAAAVALPLAVAARTKIAGEPPERILIVTAAVIAVAVVLRHIDNIRRLIAGTENRFRRTSG